MALPVYIGYDSREHDAYEVCRASLLKHSSAPLHIVKLDQSALRHAGWYRREWRHQGLDRIDMGDLKPFSTDFAFTRFLVPALSLYQGWALFCDCDFLFTEDIAKLFALADSRYAVMCVKHQHDGDEGVKMGGITQGRYHRKNWSSLVLYNCGHSANAMLSGYVVNTFNGRWLHAFHWLPDHLIGGLPAGWNHLVRTEPEPDKTPFGIHFTLGTPNVPGHEDTPYAGLWHAARASLVATKEYSGMKSMYRGRSMSRGTSKGGAGQLPTVGPGKAGARVHGKQNVETYPTPSGSAPKGMRTYKTGNRA